jgi:hypothetical protein
MSYIFKCVGTPATRRMRSLIALYILLFVYSSDAACPAGSYCPSPNETLPCETVGAYCPPESEVEGFCARGYYCPNATVQILCTASGAYCPEGSVSETLCPVGSYCPAPWLEPVACSIGSYCPSGAHTEVPCPGGHYCPNSTVRVRCLQLGSYCPEGSTQYRLCPAGYYCPGVVLLCETYSCEGGMHYRGVAGAKDNQYSDKRVWPDGVFRSLYFYPESAQTVTTWEIFSSGVVPTNLNQIGATKTIVQDSTGLPGTNFNNSYFAYAFGDRRLVSTYMLSSFKISCQYCGLPSVDRQRIYGRLCSAHDKWVLLLEGDVYLNKYIGLCIDAIALSVSGGSWSFSLLQPTVYPLDGSGWNTPPYQNCVKDSHCKGAGIEMIRCDNGTYCPEGTASKPETQCPVGFYCPDPSRKEVCPPGLVCPLGSTCPQGAYCLSDGSPIPCDGPPGTFCAPGSSMQGICPAGSYCSSPVDQTLCPLGASGTVDIFQTSLGWTAPFVNKYNDEFLYFLRADNVSYVATRLHGSSPSYLSMLSAGFTASQRVRSSTNQGTDFQARARFASKTYRHIFNGVSHYMYGADLEVTSVAFSKDSAVVYYLHQESFRDDVDIPVDPVLYRMVWVMFSIYPSSPRNDVLVFERSPADTMSYSVYPTIDDAALYITLSSGIYRYDLATGERETVYSGARIVAGGDAPVSGRVLFFVEESDVAGKVDLKQIEIATGLVSLVATLDGVDYMCANPTENVQTYTYGHKLYAVSHGVVTLLVGTQRDSFHGLDTSVATGSADSVNFKYGSRNRCVNAGRTTGVVFVRDDNAIVKYTPPNTIAATSPPGSTDFDACQCPASGYGTIVNTSSVCSRCPLGSSTTSSGKTAIRQCECELDYEREPRTSDVCTMCNQSIGCLRDIIPPRQLRIKFRITGSPKTIIKRQTQIRVRVARTLYLPVENVLFLGVNLVSIPFRRRLLQEGSVSNVELAILPNATDDDDAAIMDLSTQVNAMESTLGESVAESIGEGVSVTLDATECPAMQVPVGYRMNTERCVLEDIDECFEQNPCHEIAYCTNKPGWVLCECPSGTFGDGYHCDGNALALRISVRTDAPDIVIEGSYIPELRRLFAAVLLTGTVVSTNGSLAMAKQGIANTMTLPDGHVVITLDILFGNDVNRTDALNRFDGVAFLAALPGIAAAGGAFFIEVDRGVRKVVLNGDSVDSVMLFAAVGLEVNSVSFDRGCMVEGCWRVVARYSGGGSSTVSSVYVPKTDTNLDGTYTTAFLDTFNQNFFPCGSASPDSSAYSQALTGCCLPGYIDHYRSTYELQVHSQTVEFQQAMQQCSDTDLSAAPPAMGLLYGDPATGGDFVTGALQNMLSSRVEYLGIVNPDTNTHEIELLLDEKELRESMGVIEGNLQSAYTVKSFVGMAHFTPSPVGSIMRTVAAHTKFAFRRSNFFTLAASGAVDYAALEFSSAELHATKVQVGMEMQRVQYATIQIVLNDDYRLPEEGPFPMDGVLVAKGVLVKDAVFVYACHNADSTAIYDDVPTATKYADAKAQTSCAPQIDMCAQSTFVQGRTLVLHVPLGVDFFTDEDLLSEGTLNIFISVTTVLLTSSMQQVVSVFRASVPLQTAGVIRHCETAQATVDVAGLLAVDLIIGTDLPREGPAAPGVLSESINVSPQHTENVNISSASKENAMLTLAIRGDAGFFNLTDRYFIDVNDLLTLHFLESTPLVYTQVMDLVNTGRAFDVVTTSGPAYLSPTTALLQLCPTTSRPNYFACVMHQSVRRTYVVPGPGGAASTRVAEFDGATDGPTTDFIQSYLGSGSDYVRRRGADFWSNVTHRYQINNRYNRAWIINPANSWQTKDAGTVSNTASALQTRYSAFALIAIRDGSTGGMAARRLLQADAPAQSNNNAVQSTTVRNTAINPIVQTCELFGFGNASCAVLSMGVKLPFKTEYCDIWTSAAAYDAMVSDITGIASKVLLAGGLKGDASMRYVPTNIANVVSSTCAARVGGTMRARRLLQSTSPDSSLLIVTRVDIFIEHAPLTNVTLDYVAAGQDQNAESISSYAGVPGVQIVSHIDRAHVSQTEESDSQVFVMVAAIGAVIVVAILIMRFCVVYDDVERKRKRGFEN